MKPRNRRARSHYEYPQFAGDDVYVESPREITVEVDTAAANWSGLYDASGNRLMKPRQKIGFEL